MTESLLFQNKTEQMDMPAVLVEGAHTPDALAGASGVYIAASGSAMLQNGALALRTVEHWLWLAVESGNLELENESASFTLRSGDCCMLPPGSQGVMLDVHQEARILWVMVGGTLSGAFLQRMGALPHRIMKQGALPSQLNLAKHIVQATVGWRRRRTPPAPSCSSCCGPCWPPIPASRWPWTRCSPTRSPRWWTPCAKTSTATASP